MNTRNLQHQKRTLENKTILVVDDDESICQLLSLYFEDEKNCIVICAHSIHQACHLFDDKTQKIDFILLDGNLGDGKCRAEF